jgi:DNA-binding response OmpR family regulator
MTMPICPTCGQELAGGPWEDGAEVQCASCGGRFRVSLTVKLEPAQRPAGMASLTKSNPGFAARRPDQEMALVAVEGDMANELISGVILRAGLKLLAAANGKQALAIIEQQRPAIVIADVGLPAPNGIEICDSIRKSPYGNRIGVILLASLYGQAKYEKNAVAECGADEYLERHRIATELANLVKVVLERRVRTKTASTADTAMEPSEATRRRPAVSPGPVSEKRAAAVRTPEKPDKIDEADELLKETQSHEAARRLAASIVNDLAQFNAKAVEDGIRHGTFYEVLKDDLEEGLRLYRQQVSPDIIARRDYFQEAVDELITKRKATLGLG